MMDNTTQEQVEPISLNITIRIESIDINILPEIKRMLERMFEGEPEPIIRYIITRPR